MNAESCIIPNARTLLTRVEALFEQGRSAREISEVLNISLVRIRWLRKHEQEILSIPGPWQKEHDGKRWSDMPGHDWFSQRCNFALFRRGLHIGTKSEQGWMFKHRRRRGRPPKKREPLEDGPDVAPVSAEIEW